MKRPTALAVLLLASGAVWQTPARADDTSLETLLSEEVVTSVSRSAETSENAPALTRSISSDDIHRYGMTSLDEALDFLGVGVHTEHLLGHAELSVRGVAFPGDRSNHLLLLVDGHVINEPLFGDASIDQRLGIPLELVDHIEVVLGPGSSMYGTNAVLAVINVVTKSASSNKGFHAAAEIGAEGTQRTTLTTGQQFDLLGKRASFVAGMTYFRRRDAVELQRQDVTDPLSGKVFAWGGVANSANREDTPGLHLHFTRDRLDIMARAVVSDFGDPGGAGDFDHEASGSLTRRASIAISQSVPLGKFGDLTGTIYADTFAERERTIVSRDSSCPNPNVNSCDYENRYHSDRVGFDLRANLDWLHDGRLVTLLGAGTSFDHVNGLSGALDYDNNALLRPWTHSVSLDSVFNVSANAQQSWRPLSWIELTAGARLDWRKLDDDTSGQANGAGRQVNYTFDPVLTPRLALSVTPWRGATVKAIYAEAFRAPNPYELDGHTATLLQAQNLEPERTNSIEGVFEQRFGEQRFMFGLFSTSYHGIINKLLLDDADVRAAIASGLTPLMYDPNAVLYQYRVDDQIRTHGFNAAIDGSLLQHRLRFGASFTGSVARADVDELIPIAPQWFGNARASYDLGGKLPTVALAGSFAGTTLTDRAYDSGFSRLAFAQPALEIRGTLTGQVPWVKGLSYRVIVAAQTNTHTPFAIGPILRGGSGYDSPALAPSTPWNALFGLHYDF